MNEGMIKNLVTRIKGGNTNSVAITKPSTYKPPVPSPHVKAAQAAVDARYKADVRAGTPAARTERMKARIAAMKEEALQIDEAGVMKKVGRAIAGWGAFDKDNPKDVVKNTKSMSSNALSIIATAKKGPFSLKKSPAALQQKVAKRELEKRSVSEEVQQIDETNARHSFTAAQQVLTPTKKRILNASSNNRRAKAAAKKYEIRASKFSGWSKKEIKAHLQSMRDEVNEDAEYIEERLKASDPTSKWVSDFVHSNNPRFKGKSKKERISMALGAYYAKKKEMKEAKLDPVGQEDSDVNNDGKHGHSTDKYLMKRRAAISQAIKNKK